MKLLSKENRQKIGLLMLFLAFVLITTGGGLTWGITGALFAAGITFIFYGIGFLSSTAE